MADDNAHVFLTFGIVIIENQFIEFKTVFLYQKTFDDSRSVGAAASGDDKFKCFHYIPPE